MPKSKNFKKSGFTIVELLIVVGLIVIIFSATMFFINPTEFKLDGRNTRRVKEIDSLVTALILASDAGDITFNDTSTNGCAVDCTIIGNSVAASEQVVDGTGWVEFTGDLSPYLPTLPTPPLDSATDTYRFLDDGTNFEISIVLELPADFDEFQIGGNTNKWFDLMSNDGGNQSYEYEVGNDPSLDLLSSTQSE